MRNQLIIFLCCLIISNILFGQSKSSINKSLKDKMILKSYNFNTSQYDMSISIIKLDFFNNLTLTKVEPSFYANHYNPSWYLLSDSSGYPINNIDIKYFNCIIDDKITIYSKSVLYLLTTTIIRDQSILTKGSMRVEGLNNEVDSTIFMKTPGKLKRFSSKVKSKKVIIFQVNRDYHLTKWIFYYNRNGDLKMVKRKFMPYKYALKFRKDEYSSLKEIKKEESFSNEVLNDNYFMN